MHTDGTTRYQLLTMPINGTLLCLPENHAKEKTFLCHPVNRLFDCRHHKSEVWVNEHGGDHCMSQFCDATKNLKSVSQWPSQCMLFCEGEAVNNSHRCHPQATYLAPILQLCPKESLYHHRHNSAWTCVRGDPTMQEQCLS